MSDSDPTTTADGPVSTGSDDDDTSTGVSGFFSQAIAWVVIPLAAVLVIGGAIVYFTYRHRRRQRRERLANGHYPPYQRNGQAPPGAGPAGNNTHPHMHRRGWRGITVRADEGLNELGEAPPAYEVKTGPGGRVLETGGAARGETPREMEEALELGDMMRPRPRGAGPDTTGEGSGSTTWANSGEEASATAPQGGTVHHDADHTASPPYVSSPPSAPPSTASSPPAQPDPASIASHGISPGPPPPEYSSAGQPASGQDMPPPISEPPPAVTNSASRHGE